MKKVKLTKAQAAAIDMIQEALSKGRGGAFASVGSVIKYRLGEGNHFYDERAAANELSVDELIAALTVGYEIKPDPISHAELLEKVQQLKAFVDERVEFYETDRGHTGSVAGCKHVSYSRVKELLDPIIEKAVG